MWWLQARSCILSRAVAHSPKLAYLSETQSTQSQNAHAAIVSTFLDAWRGSVGNLASPSGAATIPWGAQ